MNTVHPQRGETESDDYPPRFRIFPNWRMIPDFPWQIWAVGWLAVVKSLLWMSTDPVVPSPQADYLAAKFLIAMIPLLVLGIGVWNLRKWAAWGLIVAAIADLAFFGLFFAFFQDAWRFLAGENFWALAAVLLVFNGPLGNLLILLAIPVLLKTAGRYELLGTDLQ